MFSWKMTERESVWILNDASGRPEGIQMVDLMWTHASRSLSSMSGPVAEALEGMVMVIQLSLDSVLIIEAS